MTLLFCLARITDTPLGKAHFMQNTPTLRPPLMVCVCWDEHLCINLALMKCVRRCAGCMHFTFRVFVCRRIVNECFLFLLFCRWNARCPAVPLMIHAPWLGPQSQGRHAKSFVELVDLYRTLSALVGLPTPPAGVDGDDMSHVVADPTLAGKTAAFSQCVE